MSEDVMVYVDGATRSFRCDCGCNVFRKHPGGRYQCNSCRAVYVGEPREEER